MDDVFGTGGYAAGWQNIDGMWYYLDTETGIWNPRPAMTGEAASYLLSNKLKEAGLQTSPNDFTVITSYEVNQRRRTAENRSTRINFNLWE